MSVIDEDMAVIDEDEEPPRSALAHTVLQFLIMVNCMGKSAVAMNVPFLLFDLGASAAVVGVVATLNGAAGIAGSLVWGPLSDSLGRKTVSLACQAVAAVLQPAALFTSTPWELAAVTSVYFFFSSGARVALAVYIADVVDQDRLSSALAYMASSDGLGTIVGVALSGIYKECGYRCVAATASGAALVMVALGCVALPSTQLAADRQDSAATFQSEASEYDEEAEGSWLDDFKNSMSNKRFKYIVRIHGVVNFGYVLYLSSLSLICHGLYSFTAVDMGRLSGATGVATAFFQVLLLQKIVNSIGERKAVVVGVSLRTAASIAIATCIYPWVPAASVLAMTVGTTTADPCLMSMAIVSTPEARRGMAISTYRSASLIGESFGPVVAGFAYTAHPALPFFISAASMAVGALGMLWKRRSLKRPTGTPRGDLETIIPTVTDRLAKGKMRRMQTMMMLADAPVQLSVVGKFGSLKATPSVKRTRTQPLLQSERTPAALGGDSPPSLPSGKSYRRSRTALQ